MSPRFSLNDTDWASWAKKVIWFQAPALLAFLVALQKTNSYQVAAMSYYTTVLILLTDLLRRWISGPKPV